MSTASKTVERNDVAPAGTWTIDPAHTTVGFTARHLMVTKVRGRFGDVTGTITIAENPEDSTAEATIQTASIDTRDAKRDEHLRSADFFDVENFPAITYRNRSLKNVRGDRWEAEGDLEIRGVSRPVTLDVNFEGSTTDPWGNERIGLSATTTINREDYGLTWNQALEAGGVLVSRDIKIELDVQAIRA